jgi:UDP:flavonoid glycosyltransferase YjiC (YdhE family)
MGMVHSQIIKQKIPVLQGYSPQFLPRPADWDDYISVTGFWKTATKDKNYRSPPENMLNWLKAGAAPIYFGFGSMPIFDPMATLQMIREICRELGVRGIVNAGWTEFQMDPNSMEDPLYLNRESVDLEWLFPQCSCLVHHGGVGTSHLGIEAGIPAVICSIFADNPLWGEQLKRLNVGRHIRFKELTKDKLITALKQIQNDGIRRNAIRVANQVKTENGVRTAVDFIEQHMTSAPVYRNG